MKTLRKTTRKRLQSCRSRAAVRPAFQTKRLGDGFYEQKLIREQIAELTGRRFLDEYDGEQYANDEEQYKALMNAGIQFGKDYGLRVGIALTAEQMAKLTTDIVWLVEKEVTLPDGTKTKVLVPQVYALVKPGDIDGSGNLLSAKSIDLKLKGDMVNSGFKTRHAKGLYLAVIPFFGFFLSGYLVVYLKNNHVLSSIAFELGWIQGLTIFFYVALLYRCPRCGTVPTSSAKGTTGVLLFPKKCSKCHAPLLPEHKWSQD